MSYSGPTFQIGGKYNWKNQPERLVYIGHNWSRNGYWHQFAKVDAPTVVWCEVLSDQLSSFEETIDPPQTTPIDMILHCPKCGLQHVDTEEHWGGAVEIHRSHLCVPAAGGCGHIWRPADVPTNGVAAIKTTGKADSPIANPSVADLDDQLIFGCLKSVMPEAVRLPPGFKEFAHKVVAATPWKARTL